jgi:hypothetical protein
MPHWSLRDEIWRAAHRWPLILLCCLLGMSAGWAVGRVWPAPMSAATDLYVALNMDNWQGDHNAATQAGYAQFNYPDDYKNWQMANLNTLIFADSVLEDALTELRAADPVWNTRPTAEVRAHLSVYWRNVGRWRLVAAGYPTEENAQLVLAWRDVVLETVGAAIAQAQAAAPLSRQLDALSAAQTDLTQRSTQIEEARTALDNWRADAANRPADAPVAEREARNLAAAIGAAVDAAPAVAPVLAAQPPFGAPLADFSAWSIYASDALRQEAASIYAQNQALEGERLQRAAAYSATIAGSYGFSPGLEVRLLEDTPPQVSQARPTASLALVGMLLGFLVWLTATAARIGRRGTA